MIIKHIYVLLPATQISIIHSYAYNNCPRAFVETMKNPEVFIMVVYMFKQNKASLSEKWNSHQNSSRYSSERHDTHSNFR